MSHEATAYVKRLNISSSPQKLILFMIADRISNETGTCFPGQELISQETSISLRQVNYHIGELCRAGLLEKRLRYNSAGNRTSNCYSICGFMKWLDALNEISMARADAAIASLNGIEKQRESTKRGNPHLVDEQLHAGLRTTTCGNPHLDYTRVSAYESKESNSKRNPKGKEAADASSPPPSGCAGQKNGWEKESQRKRGQLEFPDDPANAASADERITDEIELGVLARDSFEQFQKIAQEVGLSRPIQLSPRREISLKIILRNWGIGNWLKAMENLRSSKFCCGMNSRGWKAGIDDVLKPDFFEKLLEGQFNTAPQQKGASAGRASEQVEYPPRWKLEQVSEFSWRRRMQIWDEKGRPKSWPNEWGPPPWEKDCAVFPEILAEYKIGSAA